MLAKCFLCGREVDEFVIMTFKPERAVCFDCDKAINQNSNVKRCYIRKVCKGGDKYGKQK